MGYGGGPRGGRRQVKISCLILKKVCHSAQRDRNEGEQKVGDIMYVEIDFSGKNRYHKIHKIWRDQGCHLGVKRELS